jgi:hypothetical protein
MSINMDSMDIDLSSLELSTGTFSDITVNRVSAGSGFVYQSTSASPTWTTTDNAGQFASITHNNTIDLKGEGADIKVNGVSLMNTLLDIQTRLGVLRPNTEIEQEWDELRELGEKYRALEKDIKEKISIWEKLKAMPPPKLD